MFDNLLNNRWVKQILQPGISDSQWLEKLQQARQHLPIPVFWLLGKAQSGKSSIIQALTGSTRAEVGVGFKPCTRRAAVFDFPDSDTAFVRFLDTKGLGEADYDPREDIAWCQGQAHLIMVVVKALDHELDAVHTALQAIRRRQPDWPVLIVQTCLHEGYTSMDMQHVQPYGYSGQPFDSRLPPELLRSLTVQRASFEPYNARFVCIDFTLEEDGYIPQYYGLGELWTEIEACLPLGLGQMLRRNPQSAAQLNDVYSRHARPHVIGYAISAGLLAMTPLPAVGVPLVISAQGKLFHSLASIYGLPLTSRSLYEVASAVGIGGFSAGVGARELAKLIPGWGSLISGLSTAAITYALGMTFCYYYARTRQGEVFSAAALKSVYEEQLLQGRELLKQRFGG